MLEGLIDKVSTTFGLPDIFTGTGYKYAVIPSSNHMRWLAARTLENIPLPTSGLPFSLFFVAWCHAGSAFLSVHCSICAFATWKFEHRVKECTLHLALCVSHLPALGTATKTLWVRQLKDKKD